MQQEITRALPLLGPDGNLTMAGYAKKLLPLYRRSDIKAPKIRIKEWDYYLINNGRFAFALTVADNGYMGLDSVSLLDFENNINITTSPMSFMPMGKVGMPPSSLSGDVCHGGRKHRISYKIKDGKRYLSAHMENFGPDGLISGEIELFDIPEESMVICTPFDKPGHFYFNQKINCMRAKGSVSYGGRTYRFDPEDSFAVLDWGRGVWTYHNTWYWGSASYKVDGVSFGWNIGYGFGDCSAASENMLFYDGKAHKLDKIKFNIPGDEKDFMSPWTFTSNDGRFEMDFVPVMDRAACTDALIIKSDQHQVFGRFSGRAVLDDGKIINVKDFPGFAEKVENKW